MLNEKQIFNRSVSQVITKLQSALRFAIGNHSIVASDISTSAIAFNSLNEARAFLHSAYFLFDYPDFVKKIEDITMVLVLTTTTPESIKEAIHQVDLIVKSREPIGLV